MVRVAEAKTISSRMRSSMCALLDVVHVDIAPARAARDATSLAIAQAYRSLHGLRQRTAAFHDAPFGAQIADRSPTTARGRRPLAELHRPRSGIDLRSTA